MRPNPVVALAALLLAGGSTAALAQSGYGGYQPGPGGPNAQYRSPGPGGGPGMNGPGGAGPRYGGTPDLNRNPYDRDWIPGPLSPAARNETDGLNAYGRYWPPGPLSPAATNNGNDTSPSSSGRTFSGDREAVRQELGRAGFRNVQFLDAMFLVHAVTPTGQQVTMIVNPPGQDGPAGANVAGARQPFGAAQPGGGERAGSNRNPQMGSGQERSTPPIMRPGLLSEDQVRSQMQDEGFTNISDMSQDRNTYTGTADWWGEQVNFRVDARNGFVIDPDHLTQGQVRNMLDQEGWDFVGTIQLAGTSYRVQATRNDTPYTLWIDARTGRIDRQIAGNGSNPDSQSSAAR